MPIFGDNYMQEHNILPYLWENEIKDKRVLKYLDKDRLATIIVDGGVWWYELSNSRDTLPKYVFEYFKKLLTKDGKKWLFYI